MDEVKFKDCYELQLIDCNCNNCFYMVRDLKKYEKWEEWHWQMQWDEFEAAKTKAIADAQRVIDEAPSENIRKSGEGMLREANKMKFQFSRVGLVNYGRCAKFNNDVAFLPMTCQIETQHCFVHRRDVKQKTT